MAFQKSYDEVQPVREPACIHLRSKSIYTTGDMQSEPLDDTGSRHCWCNLTQHVLGPDQQDVERRSCIPGRECYCDSYDV